MTALVGILAIGTFGFYGLMILLTIILWACIENERPGLATVSVVAALALMGWLGDFNVIAYAKQTPLHFVEVFVSYVVLGVVWSVVKWWFYVSGQARRYHELKNEFLESNQLPLDTPMDKNLKKVFADATFGKATFLSKRPRAKENKGRILTWMIYWPWSAIWTIINDPVVRLFKEIFARTQKIFDSISKRAFAGIDE